MFFVSGRYLCLVVLVLALAPFGARADTMSFGFEGTISPPTDDFVVQFLFTIYAGSSSVSIATLSNGGGTFDPAAAPYGGQTVDAGGFQTLLSLFDLAGNLISTSTACGVSGGDACMGGLNTALDPLGAGTYRLALTEYGNYPNTNSLTDGFNWDNPDNQPPGGPFPDGVGGNLTGNYALEILNVDDATTTPEPGGFWLFGGGMAAITLGVFRRKRPGATAG
jgi:hypothetical protein